jgi:hypothetical protein
MVNKFTSSHKQYGVIELFEKYWVAGKTFYGEDVEMSNLEHYGFPRRSQEDAQKLHHGEVSVEELWEEYLSTFQIRLAQELNTIRRAEQFEQSENEQ